MLVDTAAIKRNRDPAPRTPASASIRSTTSTTPSTPLPNARNTGISAKTKEMTANPILAKITGTNAASTSIKRRIISSRGGGMNAGIMIGTATEINTTIGIIGTIGTTGTGVVTETTEITTKTSEDASSNKNQSSRRTLTTRDAVRSRK